MNNTGRPAVPAQGQHGWVRKALKLRGGEIDRHWSVNRCTSVFIRGLICVQVSLVTGSTPYITVIMCRSFAAVVS